jgi:hypothetical protein
VAIELQHEWSQSALGSDHEHHATSNYRMNLTALRAARYPACSPHRDGAMTNLFDGAENRCLGADDVGSVVLIRADQVIE